MPPAGAPGTGGRGPIKVPQKRSLLLSAGPTGHYLVNAQGTPTQLRGNAGWAAPVMLSREEMVQYLDACRDQRFNAVLVELINVADGYVASRAPANYYNDLPFTGTVFSSSLNNAYWSHVDFFIDQCAARDIVVVGCCDYVGAGGGSEGWWSQITAQGQSAQTTYGAALGARYQSRDNLIWCVGGDWDVPDLSYMDALKNGILSQDTRHLITGHTARDPGNSGSQGKGTFFGSYINLESTYTGWQNVPQRAQAAWQVSPAKPSFHIEGHYEGTLSGQPTLTDQQLRVQAWQAYLNGLHSHFYSHHLIWPFSSGWQSVLFTNVTRAMNALHAFMDEVQWWKLEPDISNALMTSSRGSNENYLSAMLASDASFFVAATPSANFTLDTTLLQGTANLNYRWIDPSNGVPSSVSSIAQNSSQSFTTPGTNAAGGSDWVLHGWSP